MNGLYCAASLLPTLCPSISLCVSGTLFLLLGWVGSLHLARVFHSLTTAATTTSTTTSASSSASSGHRPGRQAHDDASGNSTSKRRHGIFSATKLGGVRALGGLRLEHVRLDDAPEPEPEQIQMQQVGAHPHIVQVDVLECPYPSVHSGLHVRACFSIGYESYI